MTGDDQILGQTLASTYRISRRISAGGMGVVYAAENVRLPSVRYAVKVLRPKWTRDKRNYATNYARFRREAEIVSSLRHPGIVSVMDFNKTEHGFPFLVMELLEGEDLETRLKREARLRPEALVKIVREVGSALQHAHDAAVVHRDLKPSNIFLCSNADGSEQSKILDFGISKDLVSKQKVTQPTEGVIGTASYMSPEQARGRLGEIDATSDIFSLATIVYRCLTGRRPFQGANEREVLRSICFDEPPPATGLLPGLPPEVDRVLRRGHAKRKADRYRRVERFVGDLIAALAGQHPEEADTGRTQPLGVIGEQRPEPRLRPSQAITAPILNQEPRELVITVPLPRARERVARNPQPDAEPRVGGPREPRARPWLPVGAVLLALASLAAVVMIMSRRQKPWTEAEATHASFDASAAPRAPAADLAPIVRRDLGAAPRDMVAREIGRDHGAPHDPKPARRRRPATATWRSGPFADLSPGSRLAAVPHVLEEAAARIADGNYTRARRLARECLRVAPGHSDTILTLGIVACRQKDRGGAKWAYHRLDAGRREKLKIVCGASQVRLD